MEHRYSFTLEDYPLQIHLIKTHEGVIVDVYRTESDDDDVELIDSAIYPNEDF